MKTKDVIAQSSLPCITTVTQESFPFSLVNRYENPLGCDFKDNLPDFVIYLTKTFRIESEPSRMVYFVWKLYKIKAYSGLLVEDNKC